MKKQLKQLCLLLTMSITTISFGQSTWYFGNLGGIQFNGGVTSVAPGSVMNTGEGSAVLVNECNKVMLYTDGVKVWNGSGTQQITGSLLTGNSSSTQTALIVPIPNSTGTGGPTKAFIFTTAEAETGYGNNNAARAGLRVTLVSISGTAPTTTITIVNTATDFNIRLTPLNRNMSEKLTVTPDGAGGYWVLTHGVGVYETDPSTGGLGFNTADESRFFAYRINSTTNTIALLDATEISSNITTVTATKSFDHGPGGTSIFLNGVNPQLNGQGQLKVVKTGTTTAKVACTLPYFGNVNWILNPVGQVFDFNLTTGVVSNPLQFSLGFNPTSPVDTKDGTAYGVEFSPNGRYLYVSSSMGTGMLTSIKSRIYQYDLNTWTVAAIQASRYEVAELPASGATGFGQLQIGPDNKIYAARGNKTFIDVINTPNVAGAGSGYASGVAISGTCLNGLPNNVLVATTNSTPTLTVPTIVCQGNAVTVTGGYTGQTPSNTFWEIYSSDITGNPVNCAGVIGTACYDFNQWYTGAPGVFTFPGSASLACGKYYTIKLALTNGCSTTWNEITKTIYIQCNPTPVITSSTANPICYGSSIDLCVNYTPGSGVVIDWANTIYNYPSFPLPGDNISCIHTTPTDGLVYWATVTQNSCRGTAYYTTTLESNNPDFGLAVNHAPSSPYYTFTATPAVTPGPGVNTAWEVVQIDPVSGANISGTQVSTSNWATGTATSFPYYNYLQNYVSVPFVWGTGPIPGQFQIDKKYKVSYATWTTSCPLQIQSYTIQLGHAMSGSEFIIENAEPSTTIAQSLTGIVEQSSIEEVFIYPNPSNGNLTIDFSNDEMKNVQIFDVMGKLVYSKDATNEKVINVDIIGHAKGIYFLNVISNNKKVSKKIVVE